jgi:hypothetical protein
MLLTHIRYPADEPITENTEEQLCFVWGFGMGLKVDVNEDDNNTSTWIPSKLQSFSKKC